MIYFCCDERRRAFVRDHGVVEGIHYNGIDFLEVGDPADPSEENSQHVLRLHFIKQLPAGLLNKRNIVIEGGERIRGIKVLGVKASGKVLTVIGTNPPLPGGGSTAGVGDFSVYTLRLVPPEGSNHEQLFDPMLCAVDFSFKVECPSDFDCQTDRSCPPEVRDEPDIDYLAKDFNSFRQLMLDRMSILMPQWTERNLADQGIALIELLAYVGDHLSYQQDAIAAEAYLDTARRRVSVRRLALLVDYFMHDGCNARAWICFEVNADNVKLDEGARLITSVPDVPPVVDPDRDSVASRLLAGTAHETFETMEPATFFVAHNEIEFYTWGDERCCLPVGATSATLKGDLPELAVGDVLIFEELAGPVTGQPGDADLSHRHAVRLTKKWAARDPLAVDPDGNPFTQLLTEIEWHPDDALPFALCVSARTSSGEYNSRISVARGNVVLADHGKTFIESLGAPPPADEDIASVTGTSASCCEEHTAKPTLPNFRPRLKHQPLTQAAILDESNFTRDPNFSAAATFRWEMRDVRPDITLEDSDGREWKPRRDLLSADASAEQFVAEVDDEGRATVRFGDDQHGLRPTPETQFTATYRTGNGTAGNVGADSLVHLLAAVSGITGVRNPMPASGGIDPESIEHVRRVAPSAFRIQERAVTPEDYVDVAKRHHEVQDAAATIRWTGSWRTVFLTIDRAGGRSVSRQFEADLRRHLERYRLAGHDLEINGPQFVPLEIDLTVCVQPNYFRSDVKKALLEVFSNGVLPDGRHGFFHPDNFSFGQPVYLSQIYSTAQKVEGVRYVTIETFQRLGHKSREAIETGVLTLNRLEIARLDNDRNFPERGVLRFIMTGGK